MRQPIQLFVTVPSEEAADAIAQLLVERHVAACAQVSPSITSFFWWNEKLDMSRERLVLAKTFDDLFEDAAAAVREKHPYRTPEILAVPISHVTRDYLAWMNATAPQRAPS
jgi:periplasmic divalent cation tolerance protein